MKNLKFTLKAWPIVTLLTIGLCFLTQQGAKLLGIDLPDQQNIQVVKSLAGWNWKFALICFNVLAVMPALEELVFRGLLFKLPAFKLPVVPTALVASALFSAAHYIEQPWPDSAFLALFAFGTAQCWLYRRTNVLWSPILCHGLFNLTNLVLLFLLPEAT